MSEDGPSARSGTGSAGGSPAGSQPSTGPAEASSSPEAKQRDPGRWLIYGSYGYTGRLVARLGLERGARPILAGRDRRRIEDQSAQLNLEHRVAPLDDAKALRRALEGIDVVAHCAGPFSATAAPMVDACIASGTHYLDITGEIAVFEALFARSEEARAAGVVLLPGSGFDVVPSDCLLSMVAAKVQSPICLELAFRMGGSPSPGTAKTAIEGLSAMSLGRVDGEIVPVPADRQRRYVRFADGRARVRAVSWGDVSTAFYSTGVPNIFVYAELPAIAELLGAVAGLGGARIAAGPIQSALKSVMRLLRGPSESARRKSKGQLWARATASDGHRVTATLTTPNGYDLTADSVVTIATRLAQRGSSSAPDAVPAGTHTPSTAFGSHFVLDLEGVDLGPLRTGGP